MQDYWKLQKQHMELVKAHRKLRANHKDLVNRHSKALNALVEIKALCGGILAAVVGDGSEDLAHAILRTILKHTPKVRRVRRADTPGK